MPPTIQMPPSFAASRTSLFWSGTAPILFPIERIATAANGTSAINLQRVFRVFMFHPFSGFLNWIEFDRGISRLLQRNEYSHGNAVVTVCIDRKDQWSVVSGQWSVGSGSRC